MNMKKILVVGMTTALFAVPTASIAKDAGDPGRLPRSDKNRDQPAPVAALNTETSSQTVTTQKVDVRDPIHAIVPDKSKDTVRRR